MRRKMKLVESAISLVLRERLLKAIQSSNEIKGT
jgi:hypothetical protein